MAQITNIISDVGDYLILSSKIGYENVSNIISIVEDIIEETGTILRQFRWSYNDLTFSNWIDLSLENLNSEVLYNRYEIFWLEFRYELLTAGTLNIKSTTIDVEYNKVPLTAKPFNIAYPTDRGNRYWPVRLKEFTFNPYHQENTIKLQKEMSYMVNQIHGHEVTYFRATPIGQSRNVIFLEHTLFNVEPEPKCIKALVPDNTFPEHKLNHNAFGIDFELPFELHIDKRYFEDVFGEGTRPQKRDIIYFPLTNRIYEVVSAEIAVQFMYDFLYWHISLQKWQPKVNVFMDETTSSLLDEYTTGIAEMFDEEQTDLMKDITNPQQLEDKSYKFNNVVKERLSYDLEKDILMENYYTTVFETAYAFIDFFKEPNQYTQAIKYHLINNVTEYDDFVYTAWFKVPSYTQRSKKILSFNKLSDNYYNFIFQRGNTYSLKDGDVITITNSSDPSFSMPGKVVNVGAGEADIIFESSALELYPDWETMTGFSIKESHSLNLLTSNTQGQGINIDIVDNVYLRLTLNENMIWNSIPNIEFDTWYAIVINISNKFNQLSYHIYTRRPESDKTTALKLVTKHIDDNYTAMNLSSGNNYSLLLSPMYLTNIRIMDTVLEEEVHSKFLNLEYVKDASSCLLIDNARKTIKFPYIGQPK